MHGGAIRGSIGAAAGRRRASLPADGAWEDAGAKAASREERSRSPRRGGAAVEQQPEGLDYWLQAVEEDWRRLQNAPANIQATPDVVAEAARHSEGASFATAPQELREDAEFVLGALNEIGPVILGYASDSLREDREFISEAVQAIGPEVLAQISPRLLRDSAFILEVADFCSPGELLAAAPQEVRDIVMADREFVREAANEVGPEVLEQASEALRGERQYMLELAETFPPAEVLHYATEGLREELFADRDFVLQAIQDQGAEVLEDASPLLRSDPFFMRQAAALCQPGEVDEYMLETAEGNVDQPEAVNMLDDDGDLVQDSWEAECSPSPSPPLAMSSPAPLLSKAPAPTPPVAPVKNGLGFQAAGSLPPCWPSVSSKAAPPAPPMPGALPLPVGSTLPATSLGPTAPSATPPMLLAGGRPLPASALLPLPLPAPLPFTPAPAPAPPLAPALAPAQQEVDRAAVLRALRMLGPQALETASPELKSDREFILASAASPKEAFEHASDALRAELGADRGFMLQVAQQQGSAVLPHVSMALRGDKEFLLQVAPNSAKEVLQYASEPCRKELYADRAFMLRAVKELGPELLREASPELRGDRAFLLQATQSPRAIFQCATEQLRALLTADRAFMLKAVREFGPGVLLQASMKLRSEKGFIIYSTSSAVEAVQYASPSLRKELHADRAIMTRMVTEVGPCALRDCADSLRNDRAFLTQSAGSPGESLRYAGAELQAELLADTAFMRQAVTELGLEVAAELAPALRSRRDLLLEVSPFAALALRSAAPALQAELRADEAFMAKVRSELASDAPELAALKADKDFMVGKGMGSDAAEMEQAVKEKGLKALDHASPTLLGDRNFILRVAPKAADALQRAAPALRAELCADRTFMLRAAKEMGIQAVQKAAPALLGDRAFILEAAPRAAEAFKCASKALRREFLQDHDFMVRAVKELGTAALQKASPKLLGSREFIFQVAPAAAESLKFATPELRTELCGDRSFMLRAVKEGGSRVLEQASAELRGDLGFMLEVSNLCAPGEAMKFATPELQAMMDDDDDEDEEDEDMEGGDA